MTALSAESWHEDPLDPERIFYTLPESERSIFLAEYDRAIDEARDMAGWKHLQRFLRLWSMHTIALAQPGYEASRNDAIAGTGDGMSLDDLIRQRRADL